MRTPLLILLGALALAAGAADWPWLGGPNRDGISPETGLLRAWPAEGPKLLWSAKLANLGYGGAVTRDGKVYILDASANMDILRCLDLQTGAELWAFERKSSHPVYEYPGARSLPSVDADTVYFTGISGQVTAIDLATHRPRWTHDIVEEYRDAGSVPGDYWRDATPQWGVSQCPVLYRDLVIMAPLSGKAGLVAYDRVTGVERWRSPYCGRLYFCHATPLLTTLGGVEQCVVYGNKTLGSKPPAVVSGVEAATGKLLWQTETTRHLNLPIPQPVAVGQDRLFLAGGYRHGCSLLQVTRKDDVWSTAFVFSDNNNCSPLTQTPIFYGGHIYAKSTDRPHNAARMDRKFGFSMVTHGLECLTLDGAIQWETGAKDDMNQGALLIADGLIFTVDAVRGDLRLFDAAPDALRERARAHVLNWTSTASSMDVGPCASLALSDGKLLVRDRAALKCFAVR
jgi:outer membrane protein assembly factor BamB